MSKAKPKKKPEAKPQAKPKSVLCIPFLGFFLIGACVTLCIVNLITPTKAWSAVEDRPLKSASSLDWKEAAQNGFAAQAEEVCADQFAGRGLLMHINYLFRTAMNQNEINGVYIGDSMLFLDESAEDPLTALKAVSSISSFLGSTGLPGALMVVPSAMTIEKDRLPGFVNTDREEEVLSQIASNAANPIVRADVQPALREAADQYIYYRTDHHWTSLGASIGAKTLLEAMGKTFDAADYQNLQVSDSFQGTLASRTGSVGLEDDVFICPPVNDPQYVVTWADGTKTASIYHSEALSQKDQYQVFLGANQSVVRIETDNDSEENLLLFKDSYANSMVQYLLPYFGSITIVDPRYYTDDLNSLIAADGITQCAFVYSCSTFSTGTDLSAVLDAAVSARTEQAQNGQ